ncbi:MAG TPA: hypothetical protein VFG54_07185 [Prolixibacteraceae bacterium]|nr:hypothetical protein [Prolixibacteraceae bacterium]
MKRLFFLSLGILIALHVRSQYRIEVETGEKKMSKGNQTAFTIMIPDAKTDEIQVLWRKYVNIRPSGERIDNLNTQIGNIFRSRENRVKRENLKMIRNGDELFIRSVEIDRISNYPMDVYARVTQLPEGSQLSAFFQYTDSVFIDESNVDQNKLILLQHYVRDFGVEAYKTVMDKNIKLANKAVSKEQNRLKELQASILREEKAILRNETAIQEFKNRIAQLKADSASLIETIDIRENEIAEMNQDSVEYMLLERELTELEKQKLRYAREVKTLKTRIKSKELDIESARNQITSNELEMDNQVKVIENKQQVAEELIREKGEIE